MSNKRSMVLCVLIAISATFVCGEPMLLASPDETVSTAGPATGTLLSWGKWSATILIAITTCVLIYAAFFRRPAFPDANAKWMLAVGLVVLPVPLMFLGNVVGMEGAKTVAACGSCHVMQTFVNDMKIPDSNTLAAKHYHGNNKGRWIAENQCYSCHVDYGMMGLIQGKQDGMRHAFRYYTRSYSLPIRYQGPRAYNAGICLHCHGESALFIEKHLDLKTATTDEIADVKARCIECHTDPSKNPDWGPVHPPRNTRGRE